MLLRFKNKNIHTARLNNSQRAQLRLFMSSKKQTANKKKKEQIKQEKVLQLPCNCFQIVRSNPSQVLLKILAKPGAKKNTVTHVSEEEVGVQISSPPVDGEANEELREFMADVLQLRKSQISLAQGHKSRNKVLLIDEINCSADQDDQGNKKSSAPTVHVLHKRLLASIGKM